MKALALARSNLTRFLRDRSNVFFVFVLPIGIVLLIGAQFGSENTPSIAVYDGSASPIGREIIETLAADARVDVVEYGSEDSVLRAVERGGRVAAGVVVPPDLEATVEAGGTAEVGFLSRPDGLGPQMQAIVGEAVAAATDQLAAERFAVQQGADPAVAAAAAAEVAGQVPGIAVNTTTSGESLFEGVQGQFDIGASSQVVLFMFLTGLAGSAAVIQSRQLGVTRRMMGTPTSVLTIILGEALGRFVIVLVQGLYIVAATILLFQVDWGNPVGAAAVLVVFSAVGAGAAMLFGALFRNDQQAGSVGVVTALGLAALGGSMLPLELFTDTMKTIAYFTPHAWANEAFAELLRRGGTVVDILPQLAALAGFAVVFLTVATWRMRRVITAA